MTRHLPQLLIALLGGAAVYLVGRTDPQVARWGFVAGLVSQPLWIFETYRARQWGLCLLACWYTWSWAAGAWARFF